MLSNAGRRRSSLVLLHTESDTKFADFAIQSGACYRQKVNLTGILQSTFICVTLAFFEWCGLLGDCASSSIIFIIQTQTHRVLALRTLMQLYLLGDYDRPTYSLSLLLDQITLLSY